MSDLDHTSAGYSAGIAASSCRKAEVGIAGLVAESVMSAAGTLGTLGTRLNRSTPARQALRTRGQQVSH